MSDPAWSSAADDRRRGHRGEPQRGDVIEATSRASPERNPVLNAFTAITADRARARAASIDAARRAGSASARWPACRSR